MKFSIILPTRGNINDLKQMLDAFERTTRNKDTIEVLLATDEQRADIPYNISQQGYTYSIRCYERPKTDNFIVGYYNWLADRSTGDNIWAFNDDAFVITQDWDVKILDKICSKKIYMVETFDSTRKQYNHNFPCFPIVSRDAVNIVGYFFHPRVRMYPADILLHQFYLKCGCVIDALDIYIVHNHILETDISKSRMLQIYQEDLELWKQDPLNMSSERNRIQYFLNQESK